MEANSETAVNYASDSIRSHSDADADALDRISGLPDCLLLHILTLLPTKCVVKTSLLSKRWQFLWTFIPVLDFHDRHNSGIHWEFPGLNRFVAFINHTLSLNQSPKIHMFRIQILYMKLFASDVDAWLSFATTKNVEHLDLDVSHPCGDYNSCYIVPRNVLCNSSLLTLKLTECRIGGGGGGGGLINWKSLKVLSLSRTPLSNDLFQDVLRAAPSLESLELLNCAYYDFLDLRSSKTLKKLAINEYMLPYDGELRISAPNIHSLDLSGFFNKHKLSVIDLSSLVVAKINFRMLSRYWEYYGDLEEFPKLLRELLGNLQYVKDLTVGNWCLQVLSVLEEKDLPSELLNCVSLSIESQLSKWDLPGLTKLLSLTPLLETLVINMTSDTSHLSEFELEPAFLESIDFYGEVYWPLHKSLFTLTMLNLKSVKIVNFVASSSEIELILFLLNNAKQLQKMIIHALSAKHWHVSLEESIEVVQRLLSFPRCSPDAVVSFSYMKKV